MLCKGLVRHMKCALRLNTKNSRILSSAKSKSDLWQHLHSQGVKNEGLKFYVVSKVAKPAQTGKCRTCSEAKTVVGSHNFSKSNDFAYLGRCCRHQVCPATENWKSFLLPRAETVFETHLRGQVINYKGLKSYERLKVFSFHIVHVGKGTMRLSEYAGSRQDRQLLRTGLENKSCRHGQELLPSKNCWQLIKMPTNTLPRNGDLGIHCTSRYELGVS